MSKVTICDWCKRPFDDDQLKPVVFPAIEPEEPKADASICASGICLKDEEFDLCTECNGQVLSRLRSQKVELPTVRKPAPSHFDEEEDLGQEDASGREERKANRRKRRDADVWPMDRDAKVAALESGRMPHRGDQTDDDGDPPPRRSRANKRVLESSTKAQHAGNKRKCPHMNKGSIRGIKGGGVPWRQCLDCGKKIPMKRPDERSFQAPPAGCNLKSSNSRRG